MGLSFRHTFGTAAAVWRRPLPLVNAASFAGGLSSFEFPVDYDASAIPSMDPTGFFAHPLPPDLFPFHPELPASASWDGTSASSWLPVSTQQPNEWDDRSIQPLWDDLVSSYIIDHSIDRLMADINDEYSSSRFSSAPPSSIAEDDDWSSHGWSSSNSRPISAAPWSPYGDPIPHLWDGTNWAAADSLNLELDVLPVDEARDMDAHLGWDFKRSNVKWLDTDVSSEVVEFPQGIKLTETNKIYAFHRVTGCPSQFPFFRQRTGFLDQDSHSWGRSTGARSKPDAYVSGSFFGLSGDVKIACRWAAPECGGVTACESLDPVFLKAERRELDPEDGRILATAILRTREMQDDTEVGRTLAFHHSLQSWRYIGIRPDGTQCDRSISLRKLNTPLRNKSHGLLCSKRAEALTFGTLHSQVQILDHISEEFFVKVMNGNGSSTRKTSRVPAHPELARMAIVVPLPNSVAERYRECARKFGPGASVNKVENAQSTKDLLDGRTPSLFHPGLISPDTKTRIIQEVKAEWNELSSTAANTQQQVANYIADQEALSSEKRYLQSSVSRDGKRVIFGANPKLLCSIQDLRTLDYDTTFKPVAGEMQIFDINGWLVAINESVTVMRVWMEVHDRAAYKTKQLKFKGLHKGGKILGLNFDMEAAPLLGFADALVATVDIEQVRSAVSADPQALRSDPS
ncbi:hypothetical protein B0H13DRAFT_2333189 [Mycena leptocephala]|nr:hypothetical protein B0H13DRAFT_2333189 [Mycena leptocephala]